MSDWLVHKFGGTSVGSAERFLNVAEIMLDWSAKLPTVKQAIIVSAMSGVTNMLQKCCDEAEKTFHSRRGKGGAVHTYQGTLNEVHLKHISCIRDLVALDKISIAAASNLNASIDRDINEMRDVLRAIALSGSAPANLSELIMGHGELWSAQILHSVIARILEPSLPKDSTPPPSCPVTPVPTHSVLGEAPISAWIDARDILTIKSNEEAYQTDSGPKFTTFERVFLNWEVSQNLMNSWLHSHSSAKLVVVTGYICSNANGAPSTLKRNGSDYSASLFASLLNARLLTIWSDVAGVYSADPRYVPTATRLPFLSYSECVELSYFGAKVLHPFTIQPCVKRGIPILLKSSFDPAAAGTIVAQRPKDSEAPIVLRQLAEQEAPSASAAAVCDAAAGCASTTAASPVHSQPSPISPPSSSSRLCEADIAHLVCPSNYTSPFSFGCKAFTFIDDVALITLVGGSMLGIPGLCARLFTSLHEADISVLMISQASSQHSISFAVLHAQSAKAKTAVERAFFREISSSNGDMEVVLESSCALVCAVGDGMAGTKGVLGSLSSALSQYDINVKAVTQSSSEANITFVVDKTVCQIAVKALHDAALKMMTDGDKKKKGVKSSH